MNALNRRTVLRAAALLGTLLPVASVFGCAPDRWQTYGSRAGLAPRGRVLVDIVSDIIIPRTDTPGARDVDVTGFIDMMLRDWAADTQRAAFLNGLAALDEDVVARKGAPLETLGADARSKVIEAIDRAAYPLPPAPPFPIIVVMKELTLAGYYTSEAGGSQELSYNMDGTYVPCIPTETGGHAESMLSSYRLPAFN